MKRRLQRGYTLIEVLTSTVVIGIGLAAAVSMSATTMIQEEMSWRVTVGMNYQENAVRLWQLGLDRAQVLSVLPTNPVLNDILVSGASGPINMSNSAEVSSLLADTLENATSTVTLKNYTGTTTNGSTVVTDAYRPSIR